MRLQLIGLTALIGFSAAALADDAPPYEGDPNWSMRALLGYSKTGGNTDNSSANALFHVAHVMAGELWPDTTQGKPVEPDLSYLKAVGVDQEIAGWRTEVKKMLAKND